MQSRSKKKVEKSGILIYYIQTYSLFFSSNNNVNIEENVPR